MASWILTARNGNKEYYASMRLGERYRRKILQEKFEWNAAGLTPGLYYFRLETTDGEGVAAGSVSVMR